MNQSVTINFVNEQVITWMIVRLLAGLLASFIIHGRLGIIGSIAGGFLVTISTFRLLA